MTTVVKNKVTFGLENVHIAPIESIDPKSGKITYGDIFKLPGAVELTLEAKGEVQTFKADNTAYYIAENNDGYTGTLKIAHITDEFATKILGEKLDETTKVLVENANATRKEFAIMCQFLGDAKATRIVLYKCSATRPKFATATIDGDNINTTELTFSATATPDKKQVRSRTTEETPTEVYEKWFEQVFEPSVAA